MTTYYISPTGNDTTGNGSNATPWLTISKAHTSASSGDTIICKDGTYTWVTQAFSKSLTIRAENTLLAIFDGASSALNWQPSVDTTISGIRFTNATGAANVPIFRLEVSATLTFNSCRFDTLLIHGTSNAGQGGLIGTGLGGSGSPIFVLNLCIIDDVYMMSTATENYLLSGRLDVVNRIVTYTLTNCALYFVNASSQRVQKILMKSTSFVSSGANIVSTIKNCIVHNNTGNALSYSTGASGIVNTLTNSCFYNITGVPSGTALVTSDPLFVDPANDNFNLRPTSPCVNTGTLI